MEANVRKNKFSFDRFDVDGIFFDDILSRWIDRANSRLDIRSVYSQLSSPAEENVLAAVSDILYFHNAFNNYRIDFFL